MSELIEDLQRRALSCRQLARESAKHGDDVGYARCMGKADAYEHAAALVQAYLNQEQQQIVGERLLGLR